jgi:hypothetical protein
MSDGGHNVANNAQAYIKSGGTMAMDIRDNSNALNTYNVSGALSAGSHRITWCQDGANNITNYLDGVAKTVTMADAGTGIITTVPPRLYLGILTSSSACGGQISNVVVSRLATYGASL